MEVARFRRATDWSALAIILLCLWILDSWGGDIATLVAVDTANVVAPILAAGACWLRSRSEVDRSRTGWLLLGAACMAWALGELRVTYFDLWQSRDIPFDQREIPFPSAADLGFLLFIPLAVAGLSMIPSGIFRSRLRYQIGLDAAIIALALLSVVWGVALSTIIEQDLNSVGTWILLAYPWGDVLLVTVALCSWSYVPPEQQRPLLLVVAGVVVFAVVDTAFIVLVVQEYVGNSVLYALWPAGFLLVGLGALRPPQPDADAVPGPDGTRAIVGGAVAIGLAVPAVAVFQGTFDVVHGTLAVLLVAAAMLRWSSQARERARARLVREGPGQSS